MPLRMVETTRLYRQIAGQIVALIDSGEFCAGSRLPPERELAVLLGVSRTSVREAIIALEIAGRVEVRVGTGIFVKGTRKAMHPDAAPVGDGGAGPFELLAARAIIEGETAALAARNARKSDIAALRETIVRMRDHADNSTERDAADREFHVRIADATGNGALGYAVAGLWDQRRGDLWARIEVHFHTAALRSKTLTDHEAIVDALDARDVGAARAAMHRHLRRVAREFQRGWHETGSVARTGAGDGKPATPAASRSSKQPALGSIPR
ncbi:MAG: FadR/GntR family transcriptional regulator [Betaproteobacteria bacterium]